MGNLGGQGGWLCGLLDHYMYTVMIALLLWKTQWLQNGSVLWIWINNCKSHPPPCEKSCSHVAPLSFTKYSALVVTNMWLHFPNPNKEVLCSLFSGLQLIVGEEGTCCIDNHSNVACGNREEFVEKQGGWSRLVEEKLIRSSSEHSNWFYYKVSILKVVDRE